MVDFPEQIDGVPHPREAQFLAGHAEAERHLAEAWTSGRLHHAWLLAGPNGIGKATLAYRFARFILAAEEERGPRLAVRPESAAGRRIAAQSHPDLLAVTRGLTADRKSFASEIRVDEIRKVGSFLGSTAGAGGWRVVIVDRADDLNTNSANALLKVLEEPPQRSIFLVVTERPQRLPATLRSRCRQLPMRPLATDEVVSVLRPLGAAEGIDESVLGKAAAASGGSVRRALQLLDHSEEVESQLASVLATLPALDRRSSFQLADLVAAGGDDAISSFVTGVLDHAHAQIQLGTPGAADPARLARWSEVWENVATAARTADVFNLDRRPFVLSTLAMLAAAAR